jgi:hypothetical protein
VPFHPMPLWYEFKVVDPARLFQDLCSLGAINADRSRVAVKVTASCCKLSWRLKLGPTRIHPNPSINWLNGTTHNPQGRRNSRLCHQQEKPWLQLSGMRKALPSCKILA